MNPTRWSLALRNFFFVVLQPGFVAGFVPYMILKKNFNSGVFQSLLWFHVVGLFIFLAGLCIMIHCVVRFAMDGLGTLSPADPTRRLVVSGLYKYSRNPMYVGVLLLLMGEIVFTQSWYLCFYSIGVFVLFHTFIIFREEPRLKKDFGQDYEVYKKKVRRWI